MWMHILVVVMRRERVSNDMSRGSKYNRGKTKKYKTREKDRVVQQGQGCWGGERREGGDLLPRVVREHLTERKKHVMERHKESEGVSLGDICKKIILDKRNNSENTQRSKAALRNFKEDGTVCVCVCAHAHVGMRTSTCFEVGEASRRKG